MFERGVMSKLMMRGSLPVVVGGAAVVVVDAAGALDEVDAAGRVVEVVLEVPALGAEVPDPFSDVVVVVALAGVASSLEQPANPASPMTHAAPVNVIERKRDFIGGPLPEADVSENENGVRVRRFVAPAPRSEGHLHLVAK